MSDPTGSGNNPILPQSPPTPPTIRRTRDSRFYYNYNIVIFLVEDTLFRIPAVFLVPDPDVADYELKCSMKDALDSSGSNPNKPGNNDEHPIILPTDITVENFRDLLIILSGGVRDNEVAEILAEINTDQGCKPKLIDRLSRLGSLAGRFGMRDFDSWSQSKILMVLEESISQITDETYWNTGIILQILRHMQVTSVVEYRSKILAGLRLAISIMASRAYDHYCRPQDLSSESTIFQVCADLFKEKSHLLGTPSMLGFVFAVILSLGHRSIVWTDRLTREDRRVLYAGNSIFTCICDHTDLDVGWLLKATDMSTVIKDCSTCYTSRSFALWWNRGFGKCNGLNSPVPSEDIRHLVRLPYYQKLFFEAPQASSSSGCIEKCFYRL